MLVDFARAGLIVVLGVIFAYLYGFIEHGYIPPAEHLVLRFLHRFSNYHIIMFGLFSALPLAVLIYDPSWVGVLIAFGLWAFLPLGEDLMVSFCRLLAGTARLDLVGRRILREKALAAEMVSRELAGHYLLLRYRARSGHSLTFDNFGFRVSHAKLDNSCFHF